MNRGALVSYKEWIKDNNRIMAPVLAILFSSLVVLAGIYIYGELMFLVPVVTFFTFHYTGLYKLRLRLLASVIVFIVIAFLATGLLSSAVYSAHPTYQTQFSDGSNVTASVTPYSGNSPYYVYHAYITPNGSFDFGTLSLNIQKTGGGLTIVDYSHMQVVGFANGTKEITYNETSLGSGIFSYNFTAQKNGTGTIYTPEISGPLNTSFFTVYLYILPTYAIYYVIIFELIFIVGAFIARSFSNSRRYGGSPPPPKRGNI